MICSIIGGFVALQTYRFDVSKQVDESVAKAFEMIMVHNSKEYEAARKNVRSYVVAKRECDARIIARDLTDDDFIRLIEFYDLAYACVEARLCDADVSRSFFARHANFDWPILLGVSEKLRSNTLSFKDDTEFAKGHPGFATTPIDAPPCDGNF
jgi:hypothetical protein